MPDPSTPKTEEEIILSADKMSAETLAEFEELEAIGNNTPLDEITPDMLKDMDPAQLQAIIRQMQGESPTSHPRSFYTRVQSTKEERKAKRKAQRTARAITRQNGGGKLMANRGNARSR
jgi:hypothetical protein